MAIPHNSTFDPAMLPALAGAVPLAPEFMAARNRAGNALLGISGHPTVFPRRLWTVAGLNPVTDTEPIQAMRPVRPVVKEFLTRVVVPILVKRYIAGLNQGVLPTQTKEAW